MRDAQDFRDDVARFTASEAEYLVDLLRGVYHTMDVCENYSSLDDSEGKLLFGDLIAALDECGRIEILPEEEQVIDEV